MVTIQTLLPWFTHHPMGAVITVYVTGILGILVYTYFEPKEQR
jgi:hypothetical protein